MPRRKPRHVIESLPSALPSPRNIFIVFLICLLVLLLLFQLHTPIDSSICDTSLASNHPILCGTSTRLCADADEIHLPRPLVVVAAGGSRAGSTWLYNALRILMRIRDPNTVAGWHHDLADSYGRYAAQMPGVTNGTDGGSVDAFRALGTSMLIKLHLVQDWHEFQGGGDMDTRMEGYVDAVFTSHRDVRQVVRSVRDMGWGVDVSLAKMEHRDFCKKRALRTTPKFLKGGQYRENSVWVRQARATIKCREALIESAGKALKMDLKAETIQGLSKAKTIQLLREIGKSLEYEYSESQLEAGAEELSKLRSPRCNAGYPMEMEVNPVTHLHKGHVRFVKSATAVAVERRGMQAISSDDVCARWLNVHGYS